MDSCASHKFSGHKFGFIPTRGTNMATALAHDICVYSSHSGSSIFVCSLDAQGAFDFLPHCIILAKAIGVIPDKYWRLLYTWYEQMCVYIRWNNVYSDKIEINRGKKQGGLTSPFTFNLFYEELIENLNQNSCGITVAGANYNALSYADDILLFSLTSVGLQKLINIANRYITNHGLAFNPSKTECMISGGNPFSVQPEWFMEDHSLRMVPSIKYLGTMLSSSKVSDHKNNRLSAGQRAFYSLQGAGLKFGGVSPYTACRIYKSAIQSVITYGCSAVYMTKSDLKELDTLQGKQLKSVLGLHRSSRTTPLLGAMNILPVSTLIMKESLGLFKSCLKSSSVTKNFYSVILAQCQMDNNLYKTLAGRVLTFLRNTDISLCDFLLHKNLKNIFCPNTPCGIIDTVKFLLNNYDCDNHSLLQMLLKSY